MLTRYENLFLKQKDWISLDHLYDKENKLDLDFQYFLQAFSADNKLIFVNLFQYGVLSGLAKNKVKEDVIIFAWTGLLEDIQEFLKKDGFIIYPTSNSNSVYEDYPKEKKRQDFIDRIHIVHKNNEVSFSNICHINPNILNGFRILCNIKSNGDYKRNIDLIKYWSKFEQDDVINIANDLVPRIYFDEI